MPEVLALMAEPGIYVVQGPMCRWHMKATDAHGEGFVRKETIWMTDSKEIADVLRGGGRAAAAAEYPISLV
eukprot:9472717-Heterocapsa_arctica.AAC.1